MTATEMGCAVCRLKISRITLPDGRQEWSHPGSSGHTVVPVALASPDIIHVCDFCLAPHPGWRILLAQHATNTLRQHGLDITAVDVDGQWAACTDCAIAIRDRAAAQLRQRAYRGWQRTTGAWPDAGQRQSVNAQLAAFWLAGPGEPVRELPS